MRLLHGDLGNSISMRLAQVPSRLRLALRGFGVLRMLGTVTSRVGRDGQFHLAGNC